MNFRHLVAVFLLSSMASANGTVQINHDGQSIAKISSSLSNLSFGNDKSDGDTVGKIIAFANQHKSVLVNSHKESIGDIGKLYFLPEEKVYSQGSSASVRLYQSFYYKNAEGKKVYVPFEGAELSAYISGLKESRGGALNSMNSSLIDSSLYEKYISKLPTISEKSFAHVSVENRAIFLNTLKHISLSDLNAELYPLEKFENRESFIKKAIADESLIVNFIEKNKANTSLLFVKDPKIKQYVLINRIKSPFGSDRILDLRVEHKDNNLVISDRSIAHNIHVNIYTGTILNLKKNLRRDGDSKKWKDEKVKRGLFKQEDYDHALINLSKVVEYYKDTFSWNGFDNKGSDLDATVRYKGSKLFGTRELKQNAAWIGGEYNQFLFGAGGDTLGNFLEAFDVIGHEYFHSVVNFTSALDNGGESGALNEHLSDILGVGFESEAEKKPYDFKIGEKAVIESDMALRDFLFPEKSFSEQPGHMSQVKEMFGAFCYPSQENDECGVHYANGVVNKAIGLSIKDIGWERMKHIIFDVATKRLRSSSDFKDYRLQILNACTDDSKITETECQKIADHFDSVGITGDKDIATTAGPAPTSSFDFDKELCAIIAKTCSDLGDNKGGLEKTCNKCANL